MGSRVRCIGVRGHSAFSSTEATHRQLTPRWGVSNQDRGAAGRLFDEVPELYDRVRPTYPDELFADLVAITGIHEASAVLEVGCGTGQATRSMGALGLSIIAVEPGTGMAALARQRLRDLDNVKVE